MVRTASLDPELRKRIKRAAELSEAVIQKLEKAVKADTKGGRLLLLRAAHVDATDAGAELWHARQA